MGFRSVTKPETKAKYSLYYITLTFPVFKAVVDVEGQVRNSFTNT